MVIAVRYIVNYKLSCDFADLVNVLFECVKGIVGQIFQKAK